MLKAGCDQIDQAFIDSEKDRQLHPSLKEIKRGLESFAKDHKDDMPVTNTVIATQERVRDLESKISVLTRRIEMQDVVLGRNPSPPEGSIDADAQTSLSDTTIGGEEPPEKEEEE